MKTKENDSFYKKKKKKKKKKWEKYVQSLYIL